MKRRLVHLAVLTVAAASMGLMVRIQPAQAVTSCTSIFDGKTIDGNVVVPVNASCIIQNSTISGNVTVNAGGYLSIVGSRIGGSVTATNPAAIQMDALGPCSPDCVRTVLIQGNVTVDGVTGGPNYMCTGTRVNGSLTIKNSAVGAFWNIGDTSGCSLPGLKVGGTVQFTANHSQIRLRNGRVGGEVTATGNDGPGSDIENEVIGGSLTMQHNSPCWLSSGNTVAGAQYVDPCP